MEKPAISDITVTHINIRESISILVLKLIALDFIAATFTIIFFAASFSPTASINEKILSYNVLFFVFLGFLKIFSTLYVILLWLNEYYEITPTAIVHNKGLLVRDKVRFQLEDVRTIKLYQTLFGKIFNFGTIELQDIRINKRVEMYLIHNPQRYMHILEKLLGSPHEEKHELRKHFFEKDDDEDEYCVDVLTQSLAIQNSIKSLDSVLFERHLKTHVPHQFHNEPQIATEELVKLFKRIHK